MTRLILALLIFGILPAIAQVTSIPPFPSVDGNGNISIGATVHSSKPTGATAYEISVAEPITSWTQATLKDGYVWSDDFETGNFSRWTNASAPGGTVQNTVAHSGTYGLQKTALGTLNAFQDRAYTTIYARFWFRFDVAPASGKDIFLFYGPRFADVVGRVKLDNARILYLLNTGGTTVNAGTLELNTWYEIEAKFVVGSGANQVGEIRVNGTVKGTSSNGTNAVACGMVSIPNENPSGSFFYDDIEIRTDGYPRDIAATAQPIYWSASAAYPTDIWSNGTLLTQGTGKLALTAQQWYYDTLDKRLFVRLTGDASPTTVTLEAARRDYAIRVRGYRIGPFEGVQPQFVELGDSIIQGNVVEGPAADIGRYLSQRTGLSYLNKGVSGNTTTQIEARFATDCVAYKPRFCLIEGGINDISQSVATATIVAKIEAMMSAANTAGIRPVVILIPPNTNQTDAQRTNADTVNTQVSALASTYNAVMVTLKTTMGKDRSSGAGGNLWDLQSQYSWDGTHFSPLGAKQAADVIYAALATAGLI